MKKSMLVILLLLIGLLLSSCGPSRGEVMPIKFEHTGGGASLSAAGPVGLAYAVPFLQVTQSG